MIELCKLIGPFFLIITPLVFLEYTDPFLKGNLLGLVDLIKQDIASGIPRCHPDEFLIILDGGNHIVHLDRQLAKAVYYHPSAGMSVIGQKQYIPAFLIALIVLVDLAHGAEH